MSGLFQKGQAAAGAAVLLAIIAALLVIFIILIPPAERAELLGDNTVNATSSTIKESAVEKNLLTISPGRIDYLGQKEIEHPLPVVNIYTRTESEILAEKSLVSSRRTLFSEQSDTLTFQVPDVDHTKNVLLSFMVDSIKGRLLVKVNGEKIFDEEVELGSLEPLRLPQSSLQQTNQIEFTVSSPGLAFWATHAVKISEVQVVGEVTDLRAQTSRNIFLVSETEKRNLETIKLKFQPDCTFEEVDQLTVTINGREVYAGVPDCDLAFVPIEFSPEMVNQGENEIIFRTEAGTYLLSHVLIESKLKEIEFPTYYFELSQSQYDDVVKERRRLRLQLDFVDVVTSKYGEIVFNGHALNFDTKESSTVLDLSADAVKGTNSLKIKPQKTIEIRELRVDMVK